MNNNELMHYGVLGMKWGVHRARLSATTQNKKGDYYSARQKEKMTKQASKILKKSSERASVQAKRTSSKSQKAKAKNSAFAKDYANDAKKLAKQSKVYTQQMHSITSGQKKAGRDFVINSTYSTNIVLDVLGIPNVRKQSRVDF